MVIRGERFLGAETRTRSVCARLFPIHLWNVTIILYFIGARSTYNLSASGSLQSVGADYYANAFRLNKSQSGLLGIWNDASLSRYGKVFEQAGASRDNVGMIELHDSFAANEVLYV
jgi:hypothetical protein